MSYPSRLVVLAVCLFICLALTSPAWAGSPVVYVSGGGSILSVNTTTGVVITLVSNGAATYEGLVVGPDNVDASNPGYLLYACDPTHNTIVRFDPNNAPFQGGKAAETVYHGNGAAGTLVSPQCGRFSNTGDLIVTSKTPGSGFWQIKNVANISFGSLQPANLTILQNAPDAAFSATQVDQGVAQKNVGDILVVDAAHADVIRTPYTGSGTFSAASSVFIPTSALLPGPYGIAKISDGEIYISNQSKKATDIVHYSAQGANGTVCVPSTVFKKYTPFFMQTSADDTLYVAAAGSSSGVVFSVNTATCAATQLSSLLTLPPLAGIALPPTTVSQTVQNFAGNQIFNFNFAAFEFNSTSCTLTVTAIPENLAVVNSAIANAMTNDPADFGFGGVPGVDLGRDGFETGFQLNASNCAPDALGLPPNGDGQNAESLAAQVDNVLVPNPRVLHCDANCAVVETFGDYPLGGLLPLDTTISGRDGSSVHFLVSENTSNSNEPGTFCGFQSPLSNTPPPGIAGVFSSGQNLSLKFKLAAGTGAAANCQNGPFVTDATALISVAQIFDAQGNAVFVPNAAIDASGNSTPIQPLFKNDPTNKQYQFSLSLQGYAQGTYSLTITFLSSNTSYQVAEIQVQ